MLTTKDLVLASPDPVKTAVLSDCGTYRYRLTRVHRDDLGRVLFVMVNPSTADAQSDDNTLGRCEGFSSAWGYGRNIELVNLFALRSRHPHVLKHHADPVGPDNDRHLIEAVTDPRNAMVICAWGGEGRLKGRDAAVLAMLRQHADLYAIEQPDKAGVFQRAFTDNGEPRHPLMLQKAGRPFLWLRRVTG